MKQVVGSAMETEEDCPIRAARPFPFWAEVLAAAAAVVCFANVLPNDFCYDDDPIVRNNPKVNDAGQWGAIWFTDYWSEASDASPDRDLLYRPVSLASYRLVRILFGPDALPHHLANIVLHALICVLTVRLCRHLGGSEWTALVAGVLFAVLPIHTEVVAPVVGRADLLVALGVLAALLAHRRSMLTPSWPGRIRWRGVAGLAAFVAMGSKEAGIIAVALAVLFDAFWNGQPRGRTPDGTWWSRRTAVRVSYLALPLAAYVVLRYEALGGRLYQTPPLTKTVNVLVDAPPWQHVLGVVQLVGMYCAKTIWPAVLSVKYSINSIRLATGPFHPHVLIGAGFTVGLVAASVVAWRRGVRSVAVLSAAVLLSHLPTANVLVLIRVYFAERAWYLPSVWVAILIGLGAAHVSRRAIWRAFFVVLVVGMALRCWVRNSEWHDNGALFAAAYRDQPDAVGPLHLYGQWLVNHDEYARGVELLYRAVQIDPGFTDAHRTLGRALLGASNLRGALKHLQIAEMQVPGHPPTAAALRSVSRELTQRDPDLPRLTRQADDNPADVDAETALVRRLRDLGLLHEAVTRFREREDRFAGSATWQAEYAVTLVYLNERDEAIERYGRSLSLAPEEAQRAVELAMLLLERRNIGDLEEARRWVEHASRLAPDAPSVLACRAELLALRGDIGGALALYDRAIRLLPPESDQRGVFEQRAKALGR
jgi:tetratricopeptide (TPR) repeat protein